MYKQDDNSINKILITIIVNSTWQAVNYKLYIKWELISPLLNKFKSSYDFTSIFTSKPTCRFHNNENNSHKENTSLILPRSGSSQFLLHSQWLSKNVSTSPLASSAPRTRDRIRPVLLKLILTNVTWSHGHITRY